MGPAIDQSNGYAYVGDEESVVIYNGDSALALRTLEVGVAPSSLAFDPMNGELYLGQDFSNELTAVNSVSGVQVSNITLASQPASGDFPSLSTVSIVSDAANGDMFASVQGIYGLVTSQGWVSVINGNTNRVIANVTGIGTLGFAGPGKLAYDSANGCLYSVDELAGGGPAEPPVPYGLVTVINATSHQVVGNVKVGEGALDVAFDSQNGYLYAVGDSSTMTVIDGATNTVVSNVSIGAGPHGIAFDPINGYLYVAGPDMVKVISPTEGTPLTNIFYGPTDITNVVFDSNNGLLYATSSDTIYVINGSTNSPVTTIGLGSSPGEAGIDPATGLLYVQNGFLGPILVMNTTTNHLVNPTTNGETPISVKMKFAGAAFDPSNGLYYVANNTSDFVSVVDGATGLAVARVQMEFMPTALAYDSRTNSIYVFFDSQEYQIISGTTNKAGGIISTTVTLGNEWGGAAYNPSNGEIFVTGPDGIYVLNSTGTFLITPVSDGYPYNLAIDPVDGLLYACNGGYPQNFVMLINTSTNRIIGTLSTGMYPLDAVVNPSTGYVYVTNLISGTVSIIAP